MLVGKTANKLSSGPVHNCFRLTWQIINQTSDSKISVLTEIHKSVTKRTDGHGDSSILPQTLLWGMGMGWKPPPPLPNCPIQYSNTACTILLSHDRSLLLSCWWNSIYSCIKLCYGEGGKQSSSPKTHTQNKNCSLPIKYQQIQPCTFLSSRGWSLRVSWWIPSIMESWCLTDDWLWRPYKWCHEWRGCARSDWEVLYRQESRLLSSNATDPAQG